MGNVGLYCLGIGDPTAILVVNVEDIGNLHDQTAATMVRHKRLDTGDEVRMADHQVIDPRRNKRRHRTQCDYRRLDQRANFRHQVFTSLPGAGETGFERSSAVRPRQIHSELYWPRRVQAIGDHFASAEIGNLERASPGLESERSIPRDKGTWIAKREAIQGHHVVAVAGVPRQGQVHAIDAFHQQPFREVDIHRVVALAVEALVGHLEAVDADFQVMIGQAARPVRDAPDPHGQAWQFGNPRY